MKRESQLHRQVLYWVRGTYRPEILWIRKNRNLTMMKYEVVFSFKPIEMFTSQRYVSDIYEEVTGGLNILYNREGLTNQPTIRGVQRIVT